MAEMKFTELTADNLFDCCTLLDAIGVEQVAGAFDKDEINALMESGKDTSGVGLVIGMKICGIIVKNLPKARNEIYTFFAGCLVWDNGSAVTVEEIRKLKISRFISLIKDFFKQDDITDFFKEVAGLLGLGQSDSGNLSGEDTGILAAI